MNFPQVRSVGLHAITFVGGIIAAVSFLSSHAVDVYAVYDQLNVVVKDIQALAALAMPLAAGAYEVYRRTTANSIADTKAADPAVKGVITTADAAGIALASKMPHDDTVVPAGTAQATAVAAK